MKTPRPALTDGLLEDALAGRARGATRGSELVADVMLAIGTVSQRRGWSVGLTPQQRFVPLLLASVLVLTLLVALAVAMIGSQPRRVAPAADLGVFEPARGRVVFRVGTHLEAVDPDDPSSRVAIAPGDLGLDAWAMPAGWSADGAKLGLTDEYNGDLYVMEPSGLLKRVPSAGSFGCCSFTTTAWLSPDGTKALVGAVSVVDIAAGSVRTIVPPGNVETPSGGVTQDPMPVWSPDGSQAAYVWSKGGDLDAPAVGIVDLASATSRELISRWRFIRHLAWSPDGSHLLVVAGDVILPRGTGLNPRTQPQPTTVYTVDIDDSEVHDIASGHYVAAAWSPDGTRIAAIDFARTRQVVVMDLDGSDQRLLATLPGEELFTGVVWHPVPRAEPVP